MPRRTRSPDAAVSDWRPSGCAVGRSPGGPGGAMRPELVCIGRRSVLVVAAGMAASRHALFPTPSPRGRGERSTRPAVAETPKSLKRRKPRRSARPPEAPPRGAEAPGTFGRAAHGPTPNRPRLPEDMGIGSESVKERRARFVSNGRPCSGKIQRLRNALYIRTGDSLRCTGRRGVARSKPIEVRFHDERFRGRRA
jgi:hypothetical protein